MRIAVISDLHLGRGGSLDDFGHRDLDFLGFLDHLEAGHERIVLVTGHTHHPALLRSAGRQLVNAGSCWHGQFQWVSVDAASGDCELRTRWI